LSASIHVLLLFIQIKYDDDDDDDDDYDIVAFQIQTAKLYAHADDAVYSICSKTGEIAHSRDYGRVNPKIPGMKSSPEIAIRNAGFIRNREM